MRNHSRFIAFTPLRFDAPLGEGDGQKTCDEAGFNHKRVEDAGRVIRIRRARKILAQCYHRPRKHDGEGILPVEKTAVGRCEGDYLENRPTDRPTAGMQKRRRKGVSAASVCKTKWQGSVLSPKL